MIWNKTDELQWVKKVNDSEFEIIDIASHLDHGFYVKNVEVDFNSITEEDIRHEISSFYSSLEEIKDFYGEDWKQIVAECIAENESVDNQCKYFGTRIELNDFLAKEYEINE